MSEFTLSPNMSLPVPIVGEEPGPQYAIDINNCMSILDQHNHTSGSGVLITPAAININADLSFVNSRLLLAKSVTFTSQGSPLTTSAPDLGALFVSGDDLYYNDTAGNQVRITQNGAITGTPGSISGLVAPASASYVSADSTFVWQSNTDTAANMDMASIILRNLTANSFGVTINAPASLANDYSIVLPTLPGSQSFVLIDNAGNETATIPTSLGITGSNIAPATIDGTKIVAGFGLIPSGGILPFGGISAPSGYLFCDGTSYLKTDYPNLYTVIGDAYGTIDSTHFNVPDLRGQFIRGTDGAAGRDPNSGTRTAMNTGGNTGNNVGSVQDDQTAVNSLSLNDPGHSHTVRSSTAQGGAQITFGSAGTGAGNVIITDTSVVGGPFSGPVNSNTTGTTISGGSETRPTNAYVNFIIKT